MSDQAEVCALSCGMMLCGHAIPIQTITAWHSLFPPSFTRSSIACFTADIPKWENYGLTVFDVCNRMGKVCSIRRWCVLPMTG